MTPTYPTTVAEADGLRDEIAILRLKIRHALDLGNDRDLQRSLAALTRALDVQHHLASASTDFETLLALAADEVLDNPPDPQPAPLSKQDLP